MSASYDLVLGLRAIRDYEADPLSDGDLAAILEAGRWTGSSKNEQKWSFVAITDRERLQGLARCGTYTTPIRNSAATVVLVQERGGNPFDIGRAAQNMMLAAKAIGVASCPVTLHKEDLARDFIGAPEGTTVRYAVALGYPAENLRPGRYGGRKDPGEVIRLERY